MKKSLIFLSLVLGLALSPQIARADCGETPGGSLTINGACSFAAPCTSTTATGCSYNGLDNGSLSIGSTGALTINAGQTVYLNPGQALTITPGGYVNIGKSGNTTGALSFGYLWLPGSGTTITSSQPTITSTTAAPVGSYIRRYTASSMYCAAAQSCPTACGYAGGTVPAGTAADGTCATTTCPATASCCSANYGQACSACNNCGTCNSGTYLCNGTCSVSAPANQTTYTYYQDADGDGYGNPNVTTTSCSSTPPAGYVTNNTDCYDSNAQAHPGQTNYYIQNRGDGSFDYDCSGTSDVYPNARITTGTVTIYSTDPYTLACNITGSTYLTVGTPSSSYCGTNSINASWGTCSGANMWSNTSNLSSYVGAIVYHNYGCTGVTGGDGGAIQTDCHGDSYITQIIAVGDQDLGFLNSNGSDYVGTCGNGGCCNKCGVPMPLGCH